MSIFKVKTSMKNMGFEKCWENCQMYMYMYVSHLKQETYYQRNSLESLPQVKCKELLAVWPPMVSWGMFNENKFTFLSKQSREH